MRVTYTVCISRALSSIPLAALTVRESAIRLPRWPNDVEWIAEQIVNYRGIKDVPPAYNMGETVLPFLPTFNLLL